MIIEHFYVPRLGLGAFSIFLLNFCGSCVRNTVLTTHSGIEAHRGPGACEGHSYLDPCLLGLTFSPALILLCFLMESPSVCPKALTGVCDKPYLNWPPVGRDAALPPCGPQWGCDCSLVCPLPHLLPPEECALLPG